MSMFAPMVARAAPSSPAMMAGSSAFMSLPPLVMQTATGPGRLAGSASTWPLSALVLDPLCALFLYWMAPYFAFRSCDKSA
ncbi:MAG: hypothetical protein U0263_14670 [Polyangiaceae bacterium]